MINKYIISFVILFSCNYNVVYVSQKYNSMDSYRNHLESGSYRIENNTQDSVEIKFYPVQNWQVDPNTRVFSDESEKYCIFNKDLIMYFNKNIRVDSSNKSVHFKIAPGEKAIIGVPTPYNLLSQIEFLFCGLEIKNNNQLYFKLTDLKFLTINDTRKKMDIALILVDSIFKPETYYNKVIQYESKNVYYYEDSIFCRIKLKYGKFEDRMYYKHKCYDSIVHCHRSKIVYKDSFLGCINNKTTKANH